MLEKHSPTVSSQPWIKADQTVAAPAMYFTFRSRFSLDFYLHLIYISKHRTPLTAKCTRQQAFVKHKRTLQTWGALCQRLCSAVSTFPTLA